MTTEPSPCVRGCGFFGTPQTKNLCSKCYSSLLKEESVKYLAAVKETAAAAEVTETTAAVEGKKEKKKKTSSRCSECKKKVGLLGFSCKCGHVFCGSHRYPEEHSCPADHKSAAIKHLIIQNPLIKADKLCKL